MLSQKQSDKIDMRELMKYPLMPMSDGYHLKTDKSKEFTYLTQELDEFTMPSNAKTLNGKNLKTFKKAKTLKGMQFSTA